MVGELTKAMEKIGLDMRVTALVSSTSIHFPLFFFKPDFGL